jgi:hypothetical protein
MNDVKTPRTMIAENKRAAEGGANGWVLMLIA